jgi:hypothetical protein
MTAPTTLEPPPVRAAPRPAPAPPSPGPARSPAPVAPAAAGRDVALDLVRGLAVVVLVVNHVHLDSALERVTEPFLSAAEALICVSGVVVGMVFGRRWLVHGARATAAMLLRRSFELYRASVCVVALVGLLTLVPGLETGALTVAPRTSGPDLYDFDGPLRLALAIVTLEAGPWQFNVLGFFIAALALAPVVLWALARGWWPAVLVASWAAFAVGRATLADVLPMQSEGPFPLLIWQVLFVHGVVLGWHRATVARAVRRVRGLVAGAIVGVALVAAGLRLHELGLDPLGLDALLGFGPQDWRRWDAEHFDKPTLDAARMISMAAFTAAAYLVFRRFAPAARRVAGPLLLPLGRASFYVFIVHVFVCLAVASVPALAGDGLGLAGNTAVQLACLALLWAMVRRQVLFRWIPR